MPERKMKMSVTITVAASAWLARSAAKRIAPAANARLLQALCFWYGEPVGQPFDAAEASPSSSDSRPVHARETQHHQKREDLVVFRVAEADARRADRYAEALDGFDEARFVGILATGGAHQGNRFLRHNQSIMVVDSRVAAYRLSRSVVVGGGSNPRRELESFS